MKRLTLFACAIALMASTAYCGNESTAAKTEKASWGWKSHLAAGIGKISGVLLPAFSIYGLYKSAINTERDSQPPVTVPEIVGSISAFFALGITAHSSYHSFNKAYVKYVNAKETQSN